MNKPLYFDRVSAITLNPGDIFSYWANTDHYDEPYKVLSPEQAIKLNPNLENRAWVTEAQHVLCRRLSTNLRGLNWDHKPDITYIMKDSTVYVIRYAISKDLVAQDYEID